MQPGLLERVVGFPGIAGHTGKYAVLPRGVAAARPWQDMVDTEPVRMATGTAVLAGEIVAQEQVAARERCLVARNPIVLEHHDHFGSRNHHGRSPQEVL